MSALFTQRLLDAFGPWLEHDENGHLTIYLTALGAMFDATAGIAYDQGFPDDPGFVPGWSTLLDPANCPAAFLPFLGQFVGVEVPPGTDEATARALVQAESGFARGSVAAIRSAIERAQATPDRSRYALIERKSLIGADAYHFLVVIDPASLSTPGDPTGLIANVTAVKPAGVLFDVVQATAPVLFQYTRLFSAITVELGVATLADVT